jgi:hypothetical protein
MQDEIKKQFEQAIAARQQRDEQAGQAASQQQSQINQPETNGMKRLSG